MTTLPFLTWPGSNTFDSLLPVSGTPTLDRALRLLDPKPIGSAWVPIPVERIPTKHRKNRGKPVDFPSMGGGAILCSQRALDLVGPLLAKDVEPLRLEYSQPYYVLHVLKHLDCLDEKRATVSRNPVDGQISTIKAYAFKPNATAGANLFYVAGDPGPVLVSLAFKQLVEREHLTGLVFQEVGASALAS